MIMDRNMENSVTGKLIGGIGNQLFIYSAARHLAESTQAKLYLDCSDIGLGGTNHGSRLGDTKLFGAFINNEIKTRHLFKKHQKKIARKILSFLAFHEIIQDHYFSKCVGFDSFVLKLTPPVTLHGYFQSWKYVEPLISSIRLELTLDNYSDWFLENYAIMSKELPIIVHVRRGDYVPLVEEFGLLGLEYYIEAIRIVDEVLPNRNIPVWVFSDDVQEAQKLLSNFSDRRIHFVQPPVGTSAFESMLLMKIGSAHVIANSTFSWWAAMLSEETSLVVAPKEWYREIDEPEYLLPTEWKRANSHWEAS